MEIEMLNNKDVIWTADNPNIEYPMELKLTINNPEELERLNKLATMDRILYLTLFKAYHCSDIFDNNNS